MLPSLVPGLLLTVLVMGCGSSGVPIAKARGTVTFQGKPVIGAAVAFIPDNPGVVAALATTDANGVYDLATYDKKDGAPVGPCQVAISLRGPSPPLPPGLGEAAAETMKLPGRPLIPLKYFDPKTSQLKVEVKAGTNNVFDFDLQGDVPK